MGDFEHTFGEGARSDGFIDSSLGKHGWVKEIVTIKFSSYDKATLWAKKNEGNTFVRNPNGGRIHC